MFHPTKSLRGVAATALALTGLLSWPALAAADVSGEAAAVKANVLGVTTLLGTLTPSINTALSDTGSLTGAGDMREASQLTGSVSSLLSAQVLHATTVSAPDEVTSQASLAGLAINIAGNGIRAGLAMAQASAPVGGAAVGESHIEGLVINGVSVVATGEPNQVIPLLGGQIVINEQQVTSTGAVVVNALHIIINGVADIVIASANAGT